MEQAGLLHDTDTNHANASGNITDQIKVEVKHLDSRKREEQIFMSNSKG